MIVYEGKHYYSYEESAKETHYTVNSIRTFVSKNIIEGEKLPQGWFLTEKGFNQLKIRSRRENNSFKEIPKKVIFEEQNLEPCVPQEMKVEKEMLRPCINFNTTESKAIYLKLKETAEILKIPINILAFKLISNGLEINKDTIDKIVALKKQEEALYAKI